LDPEVKGQALNIVVDASGLVRIPLTVDPDSNEGMNLVLTPVLHNVPGKAEKRTQNLFESGRGPRKCHIFLYKVRNLDPVAEAMVRQ